MAQILIVDDEEDTLNVLSRFFTTKKHSVHTTSSGEEAIEIVGRDPVDAVLLDINMPGMDGLTALRRILEIKPDLPVVMVSGEGDEELAKSTLKEGAFDYVVKPPDFGYLERTVYVKLAERML